MASLFRPALDLMAQYAAYHRDRRNIATHFIGIPLIVFAISVLLARAEFDIAGTPMNAAIVLWGVTALWYLTRGNLVLGAAVTFATGVLMALGQPLGAGTTAAWLTWGIGAFVVGWVLQFIGHYYEGRKPAFVDDLIGLLVGPMFVTGEVLFALGHGIVGAGLAVDQRDLAEPLVGLDVGQQRLAAVRLQGAHPQRAGNDAAQAVGIVAPAEQRLARRELQRPSAVDQRLLQRIGAGGEPRVGGQGRAQVRERGDGLQHQVCVKSPMGGVSAF